ncbi:MAG TPA: shikimate kinase [Gammaproteobacteria bacterium]|nr:shikimate kinase [Gammaproteobacteria bacterium]
MTSISRSSSRIILIGPMGVGKTAVGRELAKLLEVDFADTDAEIETRTGVDIGFIFEKEGEAGFRHREIAMLEELLARDNLVLSTGGGVVLERTNRERLAAAGTVVYLHATLATQLKRTCHSRKRPLLQGGDPRETLIQLNAERAPLYEALADLAVATDEQTPREVARELHAALIYH